MTLTADYFMPMAERVFGDAAATDVERIAATLARWIIREQPPEVYVRRLQREVRLPGLRSAGQITKAADALVEAVQRALQRKPARGPTNVVPLRGGEQSQSRR